MKKRALLIINPISGTLPKEGLEERVRAKLEPVGFEVDAVMTERAGHGAELAAKAVADGYYAVIAAGGDGTVNEIASAIRGSDTVLGILPFGSGNGLARHLYGSIDVDHALDIIAHDTPSDCDYGKVNDKPFFCTFGLGFDAKVSQEFSHMHRRGLISYVRSAMQEWIKYSPSEYEITIGTNTMTLKAFTVVVCNASQYGNNAYIAPRASVHDGLLDVVIILADNPLTQALVGADMMTGNLEKNVKIQTFSVKEVTIKHLPGPGHLDGEPCAMPETMHICCMNGDIKIFTDAQKPPFRPFLTLAKSVGRDAAFLAREFMRIGLRHTGKLSRKLFNKKSEV